MEYEGQSVIDLVDLQGRTVIREEIRVARDEDGGFTEGYWENPASGATESKISYVAPVPELEMLIGTGDYESSITADISRELMATLPRIPIESHEYIFGGTFDGVSILGPRVGANMWEVRDSDGLPVVQRLVQLAQTGGGFVEYRIPEETGMEPIRKLSYVSSLPELEWYVGVGFNLEYASEMAEARRAAVLRAMPRQIGLIVAAAGLLLVGGLVTATLFARRIGGNFHRLIAFSQMASDNRMLIDSESLPFSEFRELSDATNSMVGTLRAAVDERETLLAEIHHRVKNNLQIVASILSLQRDQLEPQNRPIFDQTRRRVTAMALVHEQLYEGGDFTSVDLEHYTRSLVSHLVASIGHEHQPRVQPVQSCPVSVSLDDAIPVGLILTELVTNAIKYGAGADGSGEGPQLSIQISKTDSDQIRITVADAGPGLPRPAGDTRTGLGLQLVEILVAQLRGTLTQTNNGGCRWDLTFPPAAQRGSVSTRTQHTGERPSDNAPPSA